VATSTRSVAEFPSPFSIETPPGCEGWQEMYSYWALFDEHRRESDEGRLWFWNSQHVPFPMPAFAMVEVDRLVLTPR
jgi:pyruvate, water dikinase